MVGAVNDRLYRLDTATGVATPVGTSRGLRSRGVRAGRTDLPRGGLVHDRHRQRLAVRVGYRHGIATRIGSNHAFGVGESFVSGIATGYGGPGDFTINRSTGEMAYTGASAVPGVHTCTCR